MNPLQTYLLQILDDTMQQFTDMWEGQTAPLNKVLIAYGGALCALTQCEAAKVEHEFVKHAKLLLHDAETQLLDAGKL